MYENVTYETLLARMLDQIPADIDKREGSIIYDALASAAIELQVMYIELDAILTETYAITASRDFLILRALERGLSPYEPSNAILKGKFDIEIPIGSTFSLNNLIYECIEPITDDIETDIETDIEVENQDTPYYSYQMKCTTTGVDGNKNFGNLIPVSYINGLTYATLVELLIPGEDEEDTESFRTRYLDSFDVKAYGGNIEDYKQKTNSISGVGSTKVTPVWNGGGTVLLTILDSEFNIATNYLIEYVQDIIDPTGDSTGVGIAPIGHIVTVETAEEVPISVTLNIVFKSGYSFEMVKEQIKEIISSYLAELRQTWAEEDGLTIRIIQIEAQILNITGVIDILGTTLNGSDTNIVLGTYEIPVLGGVTDG